MVRQPKVPQNTPKSDETRKRTNSKTSNSSADKLKQPRTNKSKKSIVGNSSKTSDLLSTSVKSVHEVHCSCERLNNELFQFISDFVNSQEYIDYLEFKRSIIRKDEEVQYDVNDLMAEHKEEKKKKIEVDQLRELTRRSLRVFFLELQIEKYLEDLTNAQITGKQEKAIATIRV